MRSMMIQGMDPFSALDLPTGHQALTCSANCPWAPFVRVGAILGHMHNLFTKLGLMLVLVQSHVPGSIRAQDIQGIDSLFSALDERQGFNGNVILQQNGEVIYERSMGLADVEAGIPLDGLSVFELASSGKCYTAAAIGMLKDDGRLDFDDPVVQHLPGFPFPDISLRHLLNHVSGLPDYMEHFDAHGEPGGLACNQDVLDFLALEGTTRQFAPGDSFRYSNTGYVVLASVVEQVSGFTFDQFLQKRVFLPLGMERSLAFTLAYHPLISVDGYAYGHLKDEQGNVTATNKSPATLEVYRWGLRPVQGDGNIIGSVRDHATFINALVHGELLRPRTWQEMTSSGRTNDGRPTGYGFGLYVPEGGKEFGHTGNVPGYQTFFRHLNAQDVTLVYARNVESWDWSWFAQLNELLEKH